LCSALWETTVADSKITQDYIPPGLEQGFSHELKGYETTLNIISKQQLKMLTGLARLGGKAPMSSGFLKNSGIAQASSVQRALNRLIDLKIIFYNETEKKPRLLN